MKMMKEYDSETEVTVWGFTGTALLGTLIAGLSYLATYGLFILFLPHIQKFAPDRGTSLNDGYLIAIGSLLTTPVMLALIAVSIRLRQGTGFVDYIGLHRASFAQLFKWCGILFLVLIASEIVSWLADRPHIPDFMSDIYKTSGYPQLLLFSLAVAVPVTEEFFFRGFLLTGFSRSNLGWTGGIILSSFLWSITHIQYDLYDIAWIFVLGLLFGFARKDSGSLLIPLILHALVNAIAFMGTASYEESESIVREAPRRSCDEFPEAFPPSI
ncbi:MAG: CPBP family intramembrane glutamic endopeptidase [Gammaproteobacteria bacterium]